MGSALSCVRSREDVVEDVKKPVAIKKSKSLEKPPLSRKASLKAKVVRAGWASRNANASGS
jgi:hypothetical protein